jgi:hypothetical protein
LPVGPVVNLYGRPETPEPEPQRSTDSIGNDNGDST